MRGFTAGRVALMTALVVAANMGCTAPVMASAPVAVHQVTAHDRSPPRGVVTMATFASHVVSLSKAVTTNIVRLHASPTPMPGPSWPGVTNTAMPDLVTDARRLVPEGRCTGDTMKSLDRSSYAHKAAVLAYDAGGLPDVTMRWEAAGFL